MGCCLFAAVKKAEEDRQKKEDNEKNVKNEKDHSDGEEAKLLKKEEA